MKLLIVLSLAFAAALGLPMDDTQIDPFIIGGNNALPGQFPFTLSIQRVLLGLSSHICGGAILNQAWVLTAAHCVTEGSDRGRLTVHVGRHNLGFNEAFGVTHEVDMDMSIIHPDWVEGPQVGPDDLAILRMVIPITFNERVRAVRMPVAHSIPTGPATLSGWGMVTGGVAPNILQQISKPIITLGSCRQAIFDIGANGNLVDDTNICTGPLTGGVSVCAGDSGAALIQGTAPNEVLVGIVSWGFTPCGREGAPSGVYKRISAYTNWIFQHTGVQ